MPTPLYGGSTQSDAGRYFYSYIPTTLGLGSQTLHKIIATWNVSTLHRHGHQVTLVRELARLNIVVAGLTETRLLQHGIRDIEDATLLHSGGDSHVHGVALVLREKVILLSRLHNDI